MKSCKAGCPHQVISGRQSGYPGGQTVTVCFYYHSKIVCFRCTWNVRFSQHVSHLSITTTSCIMFSRPQRLTIRRTWGNKQVFSIYTSVEMCKCHLWQHTNEKFGDLSQCSVEILRVPPEDLKRPSCTSNSRVTKNTKRYTPTSSRFSKTLSDRIVTKTVLNKVSKTTIYYFNESKTVNMKTLKERSDSNVTYCDLFSKLYVGTCGISFNSVPFFITPTFPTWFPKYVTVYNILLVFGLGTLSLDSVTNPKRLCKTSLRYTPIKLTLV